ncbi:MAG: 4Fe-4S dicluster domain-containing protein [Phycisphaerales bacterium]|nr:4Fe-4S dicluster domain-containing protein [Phycisphaerales bacterium]
MLPLLDDHKTYAILTDTTRCVGCEACVGACVQTYQLGNDRAWRWKERIDDLSSSRFTTIIRRPGGRYVRQQCRHCVSPACASACIVGALEKTELGPVIYDARKCMGCRYCMMACPYGIPRYSWEEQVPLVRKCILCYDRLKEGLRPACTDACPYNATVFGTRADMLAEARRRIAAEPGRYFPKDDPTIFGEHEVGGTAVFYLSDIDLGQVLPWRPNLGNEPLPTLTWAALSKVPPIAGGVAVAMGAVYWIIGRRMKLQAEAQAAHAAGAVKHDVEPPCTE